MSTNNLPTSVYATSALWSINANKWPNAHKLGTAFWDGLFASSDIVKANPPIFSSAGMAFRLAGGSVAQQIGRGVALYQSGVFKALPATTPGVYEAVNTVTGEVYRVVYCHLALHEKNWEFHSKAEHLSSDTVVTPASAEEIQQDASGRNATRKGFWVMVRNADGEWRPAAVNQYAFQKARAEQRNKEDKFFMLVPNKFVVAVLMTVGCPMNFIVVNDSPAKRRGMIDAMKEAYRKERNRHIIHQEWQSASVPASVTDHEDPFGDVVYTIDNLPEPPLTFEEEELYGMVYGN